MSVYSRFLERNKITKRINFFQTDVDKLDGFHNIIFLAKGKSSDGSTFCHFMFKPTETLIRSAVFRELNLAFIFQAYNYFWNLCVAKILELKQPYPL